MFVIHIERMVPVIEDGMLCRLVYLSHHRKQNLAMGRLKKFEAYEGFFSAGLYLIGGLSKFLWSHNGRYYLSVQGR